MKYKLHITDFIPCGGIHYYGDIYRDDGIPVHEVTQKNEDNARWPTRRFSSELVVVRAAKEWFDNAPEIQPRDILVVWRGHFSKYELQSIKDARGQR